MNAHNAKHTPGSVIVRKVDEQEWDIDAPNGDPTLRFAKWLGLATVYGNEDMPEEGEEVGLANANLIAESFNVAHETGLTPRQLADQRAELLEAAQFAYSVFRGVGWEKDAAAISLSKAIAKAGGAV